MAKPHPAFVVSDNSSNFIELRVCVYAWMFSKIEI